MVWYANSQGRYGKSGAKGDSGERIVQSYCKYFNIKYEAKNDIVSQVHLKIDCLIEGVPVDVKSNYYKGYLAVEVEKPGKQLGWLYTTSAVEIYGVDYRTGKIFRYKVTDMIEHVKENRSRAKICDNGSTLLWVSVNHSFIDQLL